MQDNLVFEGPRYTIHASECCGRQNPVPKGSNSPSRTITVVLWTKSSIPVGKRESGSVRGQVDVLVSCEKTARRICRRYASIYPVTR